MQNLVRWMSTDLKALRSRMLVGELFFSGVSMDIYTWRRIEDPVQLESARADNRELWSEEAPRSPDGRCA